MTENGKGVLLCLDDDPDVLTVISTVLKTEGYETICGEDGQEGLKLFEEHKDSLRGILSDAKMPIMDGLEFARKVREAGSHLPILLVTAYMAKNINGQESEGITMKEYHDAGINAHLEKPFKAEDLLEAVKLVVGA